MIPCLACGQSREIRGTVVSKGDGTAIPLVSVYIRSAGDEVFRGTVTDTDGAFSIAVPRESENDTLVLSHISFRKVEIPVRDISEATLHLVRMEEEPRLLPALVVADMDPKSYIMRCIAAIPRNYGNTTFANKAFFWQAIKQDGRYAHLSESYHTIKEEFKGAGIKRSILTDSVVMADTAFQVSFLDAIDHTFTFDIVRAGRELFNTNKLNEWQLEFDTSRATPPNYLVINAVRHDKFASMKLLINEQNDAVEHIEYEYRWKPTQLHPLEASLLYRMNSLKGRIFYGRQRDKYFVQYVGNRFSYKVYKRWSQEFVCEREVRNEAVTWWSGNSLTGVGSPFLANGGSGIVVDRRIFCEAVKALKRTSPRCR